MLTVYKGMQLKIQNGEIFLFQVQYRVPPFYKCCLCFYGFTEEEEKKHMEELTVENGSLSLCVNYFLKCSLDCV